MSIRLRNEGFALIAALSFVVIVGVLVGTALFLATTNRRLSNDLVRTTQAQYIAETGIERVVRDYWYTMLANVPLTQRTLKQYRDNLRTAASPLADGNTVTYSQIGMLSGSYSVTVTRKDETPSTATNLPGSLQGGRTQLIVQSTGALPDGTIKVTGATSLMNVGIEIYNLDSAEPNVYRNLGFIIMTQAYGKFFPVLSKVEACIYSRVSCSFADLFTGLSGYSL